MKITSFVYYIRQNKIENIDYKRHNIRQEACSTKKSLSALEFVIFGQTNHPVPT